MQESIAIIQPSLFEGWSTVVEDAKAIDKLVIVSDILLHREQIELNCLFFDPHSASSLNFALNKSLNYEMEVSENYQEKIERFAENFIALF